MTSFRSSKRSALEFCSRALRVFFGSVFGRLTLLALAGWGTLSLWNWVTTESVEEQRAGDSSSPLQIKGVDSFLVRKDGQRYWEVKADSARVVDNGDAWLALGVSKGVLFRDDAPWITMRAPRVRYSNLSRNLDAVGGVTAQGPENFSFSTPQARWLEAKKLVEIPGAVRARLREMEFAAPKLTYQWELGDLKSPGPVEVRVKGGVLRGKEMTANINTRQVKLQRDVELIFVPGVAKLPRPFASPAPATPAATDASANSRTNSMNRSRLLRTSLAVSMAAPTVLLAQAVAPKPALAAPSAQTPGNVVINGSVTYNDNNGVAVLTNATIKEVGKEFALSANDVTYSQPKSQASASGNLKVETRNSTIRGAKLFGDFNRKVLSITGNVVISAYDKGDGMSGFRSGAARKSVRIACDRLDWNYVTRQATLVGNLRIVQGDNSGTCNSMVFDEPKNIVTLRGNVRFGNTQSQQFVGPEVTIFVDKGLVSAPNVTIRSGIDAPAKTKGKAAPKAPIAFPSPGAAARPNAVELPQAPPPIESLIPSTKPMVRAKPSLPPLPAPKAKIASKEKDENKAPAKSDDAE